jgi:FAD/FMN-containing dehydrogenase
MIAESVLEALAAIVGSEHVIAGSDERSLSYGQDWRGLVCHRPALVLRPGSTDEVAAVMRVLHEAQIAVVPQGGNTGLCGGAVPATDGNEAVLSLARMGAIQVVGRSAGSIMVEAGCVLAVVQAAAVAAGRLFPLSLAAEGSCQIGGNIATNAGGVAVLRYGTMRELVLGLEVVLADGSVLNLLKGLRKDNTGLDLKQLFIGSEGTLGIITRARLRLHPLPVRSLTVLAGAPSTAGVAEAYAAFSNQLGSRLAAFELIDRACIEAVVNHIPGARDPFCAPHPFYFLLELDDTLVDTDLAAAAESTLSELMEAGAVSDAAVAQSETQAAAFWALRENVSEALRGAGRLLKYDISVPDIPAFLDAVTADILPAFPAVQPFVFGHIGDGNLHLNMTLAAPNAALEAALTDCVYDMVDKHAGSFSAEHGIGQFKVLEMARYKQPAELALMRSLKSVFDPRGLLNPSKLLP